MTGTVPDRRRNPVLRALIDDMLERIRSLNRNAVRLTDEERDLAEADLEALMAQVRRLAAQGLPARPVS